MEYATRDIKLETIRRSVVDCDSHSLPADKDTLLACCGKWWGTERRKALEYLNDLVVLDEIVIKGDDVWTKKRWNKICLARSKEPFGIKEFTTIKEELRKDDEKNGVR